MMYRMDFMDGMDDKHWDKDTIPLTFPTPLRRPDTMKPFRETAFGLEVFSLPLYLPVEKSAGHSD